MTDIECELCGTFLPNDFLIKMRWFEKDNKLYKVCSRCKDYIRARNMNKVTNE